MYDFKDSRISGVVVVTKTWEDNQSNDERPMPDISISTEKPRKSTLGYVITYHGNGLTFEDGSTENEIIVNSSGKIVSGQYKELSTSPGWYSDSSCANKIELDSDGLPVNGVTSDLDLYAKAMTFVLKNGVDFNHLIPSTTTSVVFTDETMPASAILIDVDADGDNGVVAWTEEAGTVMKVSTQIKGLKVQANPDSSNMFRSQKKIKSIDLTILDAQNVTSMSYMFRDCSGLTTLDLSSLNTKNVTDMSSMFYGCSGLTALDLSHLDTRKVKNMKCMFDGCRGLTSLDLSPLNTQKVTSMDSMFYDCRSLTTLDLSPLDTQNVTSMNGMFCECSGLTALDLSPLDTSKLQQAAGMFNRCASLTSLDLSMLDFTNVSQVSDWNKRDDNSYASAYGAMFEVCSSLVSLKLPELTNKITNLAYMFQYCRKLSSVDFSQSDTSNVTDMHGMFYSCNSLKTLYLSNRFSFVGSDYFLTAGTWYSSDGTAYVSDGNSCTIPSNKADTYTRR